MQPYSSYPCPSGQAGLLPGKREGWCKFLIIICSTISAIILYSAISPEPGQITLQIFKLALTPPWEGFGEAF